MASKLARLRPPRSHDLSIPSASSNSLNHGLQMYLQTPSITASECIYKFTRSRPPNSLDPCFQVCMIMASKCISKLAPSWPRSASPISLDHGLRSACPNSHNHGLQVCTVIATKCISKLAQSRPLKCISESTRLSSSGAPQIALKHRLQPVQIYRVLMCSYIVTYMHRYKDEDTNWIHEY